MGSERAAPHVVIFPLPAQGHINGATDLARKLASLGVSVTVVSTESCIAGMEEQGFDAEGLPIRLYGLPHDKIHTGDVVNSVDQIEAVMEGTQSLRPALRDMLHKLMDEGNGAACVVYDVTMWWVGGFCREVGVLGYVFEPFSCSYCLFGFNIPSFVTQGKLPLGPDTDLNDKSIVFRVAGLPPLHASEIPDLCWDPNPICSFDYVMKAATRWRDASGILLNSVYELEKATVDGLMAMAPEMDIRAVGPVLPLSFLKPSPGGGKGPELSAAARSCLEWLDEQPAASVLYVAFGTIACLSEEQMLELAVGLEACGERFLWVVRGHESQQRQEEVRSKLLPSGFEGRSRGRGVILWELAPQREILTHPAVGAFLTHGGWNSILEAVSRGVPMLCWPQFGDQHMNSRWVEGVVQTGKLLEKTGSSGLVGREEVEGMAREVLRSTTPWRAAAARARDVACRAALDSSGSSARNLTAFVQTLSQQTS